MALRIACLVRSRPHHRYFVNRVHARHPVDLVVIERPAAGHRFTRVFGRGGVKELVGILGERTLGRTGRERRLDGRFGDGWRALPPGVEQLTVENINDAAAHERLRALAPDVILDHGTSIVCDELLATGKVALNLHWGLSPYYRGVRCTEWALLNWDPYNIGVTIHRLDRRIDGGDIAAQARVDVRPDDDVEAINHRLTTAGTALVLELLDRLEGTGSLCFEEQHAGEGFLYLKKHFGRHLVAHVAHLEGNGLIARMLESPSRKERLPIRELNPVQSE
jgi:hypothetical protein